MGQKEKSRKTRSVMVVSSDGDAEDGDNGATVRVEERRRERRVRVVEEAERKGGEWIGDRGDAMWEAEKTWLEGEMKGTRRKKIRVVGSWREGGAYISSLSG